MSEPVARKASAVSGGQLFLLGLVLGLVTGALLSAFLGPLINAPQIPLKPTPASAGTAKPAGGPRDAVPEPTPASPEATAPAKPKEDPAAKPAAPPK